MRVKSSGDVTTPSNAGIYATGGGNVTVRSTGDFMVGNGYGIIANSTSGSGDVKITSDSNVTGTGGGSGPIPIAATPRSKAPAI